MGQDTEKYPVSGIPGPFPASACVRDVCGKTGGLPGEFRHPEQRENGGVGAVDPETPYPVLGAFAHVERRGDQPVQRILDHGEVVRQRFGLGESQPVAVASQRSSRAFATTHVLLSTGTR